MIIFIILFISTIGWFILDKWLVDKLEESTNIFIIMLLQFTHILKWFMAILTCLWYVMEIL